MKNILDFDLEKEEYFDKGIHRLIQNNNMGYLSAFYNSKINEEGIRFTLDKFKETFNHFDVISYWDHFPKDFIVKIKYSPINLFKRWIFIISNKSFFKVYEQNKAYEKEFFIYSLDEKLFLLPITTNITHERFLLLVYTKDELKEKDLTFTTHFSHKRKLVIYKDYRRRKVSTINFPKNFSDQKSYTFKVSVIKEDKKIRFKVYIDGYDYQTVHSVKLSENKAKVHHSNHRSSIDQSLFNKYRKEVIEILRSHDQKTLLTNKFANVSLGRINKIPVLINLAKNYADIEIETNYKDKEEILEIIKEKEIIKSFSISFTPKSNWLERS